MENNGWTTVAHPYSETVFRDKGIDVQDESQMQFCERSQTLKITYCMIMFKWHSNKGSNIQTGSHQRLEEGDMGWLGEFLG